MRLRFNPRSASEQLPQLVKSPSLTSCSSLISVVLCLYGILVSPLNMVLKIPDSFVTNN